MPRKLTKLLLCALVALGCGVPAEDETVLAPDWQEGWVETPLRPGETIIKEADPDDGSPGWFPDRGQVRRRAAPAGKGVSAIVQGMGQDGSESVAFYNSHGEKLLAPEPSLEKSHQGLWGCSINGNDYRCPCWPQTDAPYKDTYGNSIAPSPDGGWACLSIDSNTIGHTYIYNNGSREERTTRAGGGFMVDYEEVTDAIDTNPGSYLPTWYTFFNKTSHAQGTHNPDGFYSESVWGRRTYHKPDALLYHRAMTDIIIRKARVYDSCDGYEQCRLGLGSCQTSLHYDQCVLDNDSELIGVTRSFTADSGSPYGDDIFSPIHELTGIDAVYNDPAIHAWKPCATCPWIDYYVLRGSIITINQPLILDRTTTAKEKAATEHAFCHELGHAVGLAHSGLWQEFSCMGTTIDDWNGPFTWKWGDNDGGPDGNTWHLLENAKFDISQYMLIQNTRCGFFNGPSACPNGRRPPLGSGGNGFER